ncbi:hypothetical protein [Micromonospora kangleipakensis]|uniref:hypothetical protein n=1 Tax=Micromonospora kangleipakensis TaxID=1077942 RepID=UPI001F5EE671|nr:hypothetical protein [Micromonospora kangleipakensis]
MVLEEFGGPLTLREVAQPVAGVGQVLVRVRASGVNPLDTKIRAAGPGTPAAGCRPSSAWTSPGSSKRSARRSPASRRVTRCTG